MAATVEARGTYCKLGDLELEVFDGLQDFEQSTGYAIAEHEMLSGTNVLQSLGENLKEITLEVQLRDYWDFTDINYTLESLSQIRDSGDSQRLFFGDGRYSGSYIVSEMRTKVLKTYVNGEISQADVSLTLKEWVNREAIELGKVEKKPPKKRVRSKQRASTKKDVKTQAKFVGPFEKGDPRIYQTIVRPDGIFRAS